MSYITGTTNYDLLEDAIDAFAEYTAGQAELVVREDGTATIYRLQSKPAQPGQAPFLNATGTLNSCSALPQTMEDGLDVSQ